MSRHERGAWPGLDTRGMTLAEIRRRVRDGEGVGIVHPPPPVREPERLGAILDRIGFAKRGQDDERNE